MCQGVTNSFQTWFPSCALQFSNKSVADKRRQRKISARLRRAGVALLPCGRNFSEQHLDRTVTPVCPVLKHALLDARTQRLNGERRLVALNELLFQMDKNLLPHLA